MTQATGFEIAIVGMAGRFPGAPDVAAFWRNLSAGVESVTRFSHEQLLARGVSAATLADPSYVRAGVVLEGIDQFDAGLFGYSAREAAYLDPQQRVFLECAWQALEHAGYLGPASDASMVGVYAGAGANLYLLQNVLPVAGGASDIADLLAVSNGSSAGALCTRVAYALNLRGPAVSVQTECSTSLVAVHLACSGLLSHDCDLALAGGVWLNLLQDRGYRHQAGAILASDGHCRAFDARADGTLIGSGAGVVVLKRLHDAVCDGDTIHAVIKGSAINNDGADKIGFTAPSVSGQAAVIRAAQALAEVAPDSIGYVEAHGTGTQLGDPLELAALTEVFAPAKNASIAIGSVKTNIGHLDAAAGVAGLIKAVLTLQQATLTPSLNYATPNPQIDFAAGPFYVNTQTRPWPTASTPRRAAVSSFGIGGTNAHVVLEEAPSVTPASETGAPRLLRLSARSAAAITAQTRELAEHLEQQSAISIADADHTLRVGRRRFAERAVAIGRTRTELLRALREHGTQYVSGRALSESPAVAMVFAGRCPLSTEQLRHPWLREFVEHCEHVLPGAAQRAGAFVSDYAVAQLWMRWGVKPDALLGHGRGVHVAACVAGVLSLEQALRLAAGPSSATLSSEQLPAARVPIVDHCTGEWLATAGTAQLFSWLARVEHDAVSDTALAMLLSRADRVLLEVSSASSLAAATPRLIAVQGDADFELQLARCAAQLWIAGIEVNLSEPASPRRRIPLPTYPFERQSYWLDARAANRELSQWGYVPSWQRVTVTDELDLPSGTGCTLLIGASHELTHRLLKHLRSSGVQVAHARPGASFTATDAGTYVVRASERSDYESLLSGIAEELGPVTHVCHLLSFGTSPDPLAAGFHSLLALGQALQGRSQTVALTVVSSHLEDVSGLEPLEPLKAALHGPCRVLPLESGSSEQHTPRLTFRVIDVAEGAPALLSIPQLAASLYSNSAAAVLALRGTQAWRKEYRPQQLGSRTPRLRRNGVYVITGGLGGVGGTLASYLIGEWHARVVVLSRAPAAAREIAGARVLQADVSDAAALADALNSVRARYGSVHGVIHAAGVAGGGLAALRSATAIEAVFAPKITGTQNLLRAFASEPLDFLLLCSSLSALTGDVGQVDYCAANCVLDALAIQATQLGSRQVMAVNWDTWRGIGMAAQLSLDEGMTAEQGIEMFVRLLSGPRLPQVAISSIELAAQFARAAQRDLTVLQSQPAARALHPRPDLSTPYVAPAEGLEQGLATLWSEFLHVQPLGVHDNLFELGGDSLLALQLLARVRTAYDVELQPAELLRTPTIAALAELIELRLIEQIEAADAVPTRAAG